MAAIQVDFFNNACAVIPLLLLTKVAERARRGEKNQDRGERLHVSFIVMGFVAEGIALWGSRSPSAEVEGVLIASLMICLILFVVELVRTKSFR